MSRSELVSPLHLQRKALIYIRQSTPHQVLTNQESLQLQYALQQRALELGWRAEDIELIDTDLGLTAAFASHRSGFQELVTKVSLGQVGIVLSVEVTRLSRNCSDWYPLLDVCGYRGCLIADRDGIYDPGSANGRLLLGLKGQLSELELHTIRARMTAGLLNKAQRGALALQLPIGLARDAAGKVYKDPHREVQDRLDLIFTTFLRVRSASKVLQFLNTHDLCLPRRDRFGDVAWKKPTVAAILQILKNPAYAGAFVYGKTRSIRKDPVSPHTQEVRLPMDQWKIRVNDVYPAYIAWETFEQIQQMLADNYAAYDRNKSRGVPRDGAARLAWDRLLWRVRAQNGDGVQTWHPLSLQLLTPTLSCPRLPIYSRRSRRSVRGGELFPGALSCGIRCLRGCSSYPASNRSTDCACRSAAPCTSTLRSGHSRASVQSG